MSLEIVLAGMIGAIGWNLVTWRYGLPSSSSHALVGGLVGVTVWSSDSQHIVWGWQSVLAGQPTGVAKIVLALLVSPVLGLLAGFIIHRLTRFLLRGFKPSINRNLRRAQYVTTAMLAFSHGANDAQKSMGILTLILFLGGFRANLDVPLWVVTICATAMTAGILTGGWRIARTIGFGIFRIRPLHAVGAQIASAAVIFEAAVLGGPVSTTHVVTSSIMGVGASERVHAVRWGKAKEIVGSWLLTLPAAAFMAIVSHEILQQLFRLFE